MERTAPGGVNPCCDHGTAELGFDVVVGPELDEAYPDQSWRPWLDLSHDRLMSDDRYHHFLHHGETFAPQIFDYEDNGRNIRVAAIKIQPSEFVMVLGFTHEVDLTISQYAEAVLTKLSYKNPRQKAAQRKKKRRLEKKHLRSS